jgi:high-affinity iron transporter
VFIMLPSLLLTFREGLEAALLVGIILGYLDQIGRRDRYRLVWTAVVLAAALSLALAIGLHLAGAEFEGQAENFFEGTTMLLAVGVLTWMIFWMRHQARYRRNALQAGIHGAIRQGHNWALFGLAFLAVLREGVELALFLTAVDLVSGGLSTLVGGVIGLACAILAGGAVYTSTARLNVRRFFDATSFLLLVFAAGLFAHGLLEFEEAGWLPALVEQVWNLGPVLSDSSTVGGLLRVLVGYHDAPSLLEVIGYLGYWAIVMAVVRWMGRRTVSRAVMSNA